MNPNEIQHAIIVNLAKDLRKAGVVVQGACYDGG